MKLRLSWLLVAALSLQALQVFAQSKAASSEKLPLDPTVVMKRLPNGITYFIKQNPKPEKRVELRLAINSGSNFEEEDQRGLAHFVEHMCFNGTKNFPEQKLVKFLEGIGMNFGADLNAYTSFDETVYMLQLPVEKKDDIATGFQILEDWAHNVTFDPKEIDKERGVVIEEWRQRYNNVRGRYNDYYFPNAFEGSIYATRMPIGTQKNLETFPHKRLVQYYKDWYTPERMAVIVVGDIDMKEMEAMIVQYFGRIPKTKNPRKPNISYAPKPHSEPKVLIFRDAEQPTSSVSMLWKSNKIQDGTLAYYLRSSNNYLASQIINKRIAELVRTNANPPFRGASLGAGAYFRNISGTTFTVAVKDETKAIEEYKAALREVRRVFQHGFTKNEVERVKSEFRTIIENDIKEAENRKSGDVAMRLVNHYLTHSPFLDAKYENKLDLDFLNTVTVESMNAAFRDIFSEQGNLVITLQQPDKPEIPKVTDKQLLSAYDEVMKEQLQPYTEEINDAPLLAKMPTPGRIVSEKQLPAVGSMLIELSNGVNVVLKKTDFKNDEIIVSMSAPGGYSSAGEEALRKNFVELSSAAALQNPDLSGMGNFAAVELEKKLSGVNADVSFFVDECYHGARGNSNVKDLETMFQLLHLGITQPRLDPVAVSSLKAQYLPVLKNRSLQPQAVFQDSVNYVSTDYHYSRKPLTTEIVEKWDHIGVGYPFFKNLFSNVAGSTMTIVGSFDIETMKSLLLKYVASLPSTGVPNKFSDMNVPKPKAVLKKNVYSGSSETSNVTLMFYNDTYKWSRQENSKISLMMDVLENMLREVLREEMGGTYGVGVYPSITYVPKPSATMNITFGCAPDRAEEMIKRTLQILQKVQSQPADAKLLADAKLKAKKGQETRMKENGFWLAQLQSVFLYGEDPALIVQYEDRVNNVTAEDIQKAASMYFSPDRYAQFVLYPESKK